MLTLYKTSLRVRVHVLTYAPFLFNAQQDMAYRGRHGRSEFALGFGGFKLGKRSLGTAESGFVRSGQQQEERKKYRSEEE